MRSRSIPAILLLSILFLLTACGSAAPEAAAITPTNTAPPVAAAPTEAPSSTPAATVTAEPTATPRPTETPVPTSTPEPTATPIGVSDADLATVKPNELGLVLVLEYHLIEGPDDTYRRSPESFRADLEWLYANDYYPIRFRDLALDQIDIPAGRSPVVLTLDDSSDGQFRYLPDGSVDPTTAMGILQAFSAEHPDFPPVATFFPLLDVDVPERVLFGQPEEAARKLKEIVALGGEVGSHTYSHLRMDQASAERIQWQLAFSSKELEEHIGDGYKVISLALPLGMYPEDESLLVSGESEGVSYSFVGAAEVAGGPTRSPVAIGFDPYHINRTQAVPGYVDGFYRTFEQRPTLKYISDGDPETITVPSEETLDEEQRGLLDESRVGDRTLRRYDRPMGEEQP